MTQDTNVQNLIINKLTKAQYEAIAKPSETELYLTPDESITADDLKTINNNSLVGNGNISVQEVISDLSTIRSGASAGATALQPNDNISELVNDVGYITSVPTATISNLGLVQPDGTTITINNGIISAVGGGTVISVNGQTGTVILDASDVGALPDTTTIADLTTQTQLNAINSGATATNIGQIATNTNDIADLQTNKQDNLTAGANIQINNNVISATDTTYTAGTGISIVNNVISNTQTSAEWGNITGTLSNQTDLQAALDVKLENTATGTDALTIAGIISTASQAHNIGIDSSANIYGVAYGYSATSSTAGTSIGTNANSGNYGIAIGSSTGQATATEATGASAIAIGYNAKATANLSIQLGAGTNSTASSLAVGFNGTNYQLLDGTTGYIPNARINIDNEPTNGSSNTVSSGGVFNVLSNKQDTLVSGTNIKTINNQSILGSGDITISTWGSITGTLSDQTDLQDALDSKYDASNPNGYTSNVGTVTSVNNISPVSGNVTIAIPTATSDLTNDSGYITSSALPDTAQLSYYGTCSTAAATQNKIVVCPELTQLKTGISIRVKFTNAQTYSGSPTLNVNNTGAIPVVLGAGGNLRYGWRTGEIVSFTYDGTNWVPEDGEFATTTYYGYTKLNSSATNSSSGVAITADCINQVCEQMISGYPVYSASSTYAVGDRVRYDYKTWECNTEIAIAEAWDATHWTPLDALQTQIDNISIDIDNTSITKNSDDELQTVGVIDQNDTTTAIKTWTGTRAEYDAIASKDNTTMYYLTDAHAIYLGEDLIVNLANRNIGEIVASTIPLTDAGLHLLDGALIQGSGIYSAFVDYIADLYTADPTANYFCTETDWQTSVNTYGVCGKFVYDSVANTVRLPKVTGILEGTTDVTALGDLVEAGLPNITGGYLQGRIYSSSPYREGSGCVVYTRTQADVFNSGSMDSDLMSIDASRSSSIYGNSSTVQPQTIKCYYYIVIATLSKTDIQVDIDEVATDLNSKADTDLTNVTDTAKVMMSGMGMPSDKYVDLTLGASGSTYTAPANGYVLLIKTSGAANQSVTIYDTITMLSSEIIVPASGNWVRAWLPVAKNNTFRITYSASGATQYFRFIYAQGSESEAQ